MNKKCWRINCIGYLVELDFIIMRDYFHNQSIKLLFIRSLIHISFAFCSSCLTIFSSNSQLLGIKYIDLIKRNFVGYATIMKKICILMLFKSWAFINYRYEFNQLFSIHFEISKTLLVVHKSLFQEIVVSI